MANENLVKMLFFVLEKRQMTLASCESLTGGLFGATVCAVAGASAFYKGGVITYTDEVKQAIGVSKDTLEKDTAISEKCAAEMAQAALRFTQADAAISFTGNAGPTSQDGKPVGEVWIGVAQANLAKAVHYSFAGDRNEIREKCVESGLKLLIQVLDE